MSAIVRGSLSWVSKSLVRRAAGVLLLVSALGVSTVPPPLAAQQKVECGCNACNAGNAGVARALARGPVPLHEALNALETWYNGEGGLEMRTILVRIEDGRVRSHELSTANRLRSGQRVATHELRGSHELFRATIDQKDLVGQMIHVDEHVDAGVFLAAVEARADARVFSMLGRPRLSGSAIVVATVPARGRDQSGFTMHPLILVLTR